jgi:hypothetical protein
MNISPVKIRDETLSSCLILETTSGRSSVSAGAYNISRINDTINIKIFSSLDKGMYIPAYVIKRNITDEKIKHIQPFFKCTPEANVLSIPKDNIAKNSG